MAFYIDTAGDLGTFDPVTGRSTVIARVGLMLEDLAQTASGLLFGIDARGTIYSINTKTGALQTLVDTGLATKSLGADANGNLFTVNESTGELVKITPEGVVTPMGNVGGPALDLLVSGQDVYIARQDNTLARYNLSTGQLTMVGQLPENIHGLGQHPDGKVFAVAADGKLYNVNPASGSVSASDAKIELPTKISASATLPTTEPGSTANKPNKDAANNDSTAEDRESEKAANISAPVGNLAADNAADANTLGLNWVKGSWACSCAKHDPIAAAYEASLQSNSDELSGLQSNTILSSNSSEPLVLNAPGQANIPSGMQFFADFSVNWQGKNREEFQVFFRMAEPAPSNGKPPLYELLFWQFYGTDQACLAVTLNGVTKNIIVAGVMNENGIKNFTVQITDSGQAQIFVDGVLRASEFVGDISGIPRANFDIGDDPKGFGRQMWGEFLNFRADLDGDGAQDIVNVPPPRLPVPIKVQPIPDLPNPNPDGFTNTPTTPNDQRSTAVPDSGNPIIDAIAAPYKWRGDTITYSFTVQDIDNNGIADFDEGGWRQFYSHILKNVTQFTGVDFWERPEGGGTIQFKLSPGAGGASGMPGPFAAASSGTVVGINGTAEEAGRNIGSFRFTHTWFHETGHALGMGHPSDYEKLDGIDTSIGIGGGRVSLPGNHYLNSKLYSSTSYSRMMWGEDNPFTTEVDFGTDLGKMFQSTYLPFDIAALQYMYGVNRTNALGDDLYTFNDSGLQSQGLRTIWDNGGNDTIQYTGNLRSVINLNDATIRQEVGGGGFLSTSESLEAGFLIANGVTIENAIGGEKQDFITGNEANNRLVGNGGDDVIRGGDGDDTLDGGAGNDTLDGGSGLDIVLLTGTRADYTWTAQPDNTWRFTNRTTGETDTLRDVERVRFQGSGETLTLSETPFADRPLQIQQPLPDPPTRAFFAEATVRFDDPNASPWQRVFDFGNGPGQSNILLTQRQDTNTMTLEFYGPKGVYSIEARNTIVKGETATWRVEISETGFARLYKNGVVVAEGDGPPVPDVARRNLLIGQSNWPGDKPLNGEVLAFRADVNGDGTMDIERGAPFTTPPYPGGSAGSPPVAPVTGPDMTAATDSGASNADNLTRDNTPDFAVNAPAGTTPNLYVDGVKVASTFANGVLTPNAPIGDGNHTIQYTLTNAQGQESGRSPPLTVNIDTQAPSAPSTAPDMTAATDTGASNTDNITENRRPEFALNVPSGSTPSLYVDGLKVDSTFNGGLLIPVNPISDGRHTVTYTLTDAAGNESAQSTALQITIGAPSAAPAAPVATPDMTSATDTGSSNTDNLTRDNTPDFAVTAPAGTTPNLYVNGVKVPSTFVNGVLTPVNALPDGNHTIQFTLSNAQGQESGRSPGLTVTVDTQAPTAPSTAPDMTAATDTGTSNTDNNTSDTTPDFAISVPAGLTPSLYVDGAKVASTFANGVLSPVNPIASGTRSVTYTFTDAAGNESAQSTALSIVIGSQVPPANRPPVAQDDPGLTTRLGSPLTVNALANDSDPDGNPLTITNVALVDPLDGSVSIVNNQLVYTPSASAVGGTSEIRYTISDGQGGTSTATAFVYVSEAPNQAPATPSAQPDMTAGTDTGSSNTDNLTRDNTPDFAVTAPAGTTPNLYVNGAKVASTFVNGVLTPVNALPDGNHTIQFTLSNAQGQESGRSPSLTVTVDTQAPTAPSTAPDMTAATDTGTSNTDNNTSDTTPDFAISVPAGMTPSLYVDGVKVPSTFANGVLSPVNPIASGTRSVTYTFTDAAGNESAQSTALSIVVGAPAPGPLPTNPNNLIRNGSFEDTSGMDAIFYGFTSTKGVVTGWNTTNGTAIEFDGTSRGGVKPTDGNFWLDLEASPGHLRVGQDVQGVENGRNYRLTFNAGDIANNDDGTAQDNIVKVYWGGQLVGTINPTDGAMSQYEFNLVGGAGNGNNRLEFEGGGRLDAMGVSIDSVSLVATVERSLQLGTDNAEILVGRDGGAVLDARGGNDVLIGGAGDDILIGGAGNDLLFGGKGSDVYTWKSGDIAGAGVEVDNIYDWGSGDALDLRDLLQGESKDASILDGYLSFERTNGNTVISVSSTSGGSIEQRIIIQGTDFTVGGTLSDAQIIQNLLNSKSLITD